MARQQHLVMIMLPPMQRTQHQHSFSRKAIKKLTVFPRNWHHTEENKLEIDDSQ